MDFDSCPSTSSSSEDNGSENLVTISPSTIQSLGIPRHPSWNMEGDTGPSYVPRSDIPERKDPLNIKTDWTDPFSAGNRGAKRILKLPLLERGTDGKYYESAKRKSVRFSSPLTDQQTKDQLAKQNLEELFCRSPENEISDNNESSIYTTSSISENDLDENSQPTLINAEELYRVTPANQYLNYYNGTLDLSEYEAVNSENFGEPSDIVQTEIIDDLNTKSADNRALESYKNPSHLDFHGMFQVQNSASCDTPLCCIMDPNLERGDNSRESFVNYVLKAINGLAAAGDIEGEAPYTTEVNDLTTLGEIFDLIGILNGRVEIKLIRQKEEADAKIAFLRNEMSELQKSYSSTAQKLKLQDSAQRNQANVEIERMSSEILGLKENLQSVERELSELERSKYILTVEAKQFQESHAVFEEDIKKTVGGIYRDLGISCDKDSSGAASALQTLAKAVSNFSDSRKAEERKAIDLSEASLKNSDRHDSEIRRASNTINKLETQTANLNAELDRYKAKSKSQAESLHSLKDQLGEARSLLQIETSNRNKLEAKLSEKENAVIALKEDSTNQQTTIILLEKEIEDLKTGLETTKSANRDLQNTLERSANSVALLEEANATLESQVISNFNSVTLLEKQIAIAKEDSLTFQKEKTDYISRLEVAKSMLELKEESLDLAKDRSEFSDQKICSLTDALVEKTRQISALETLVSEEKYKAGETCEKMRKTLDAFIFFYKDALSSVNSSLNKVLEEDIGSQVLESFEIAATSLVPEVMSPYLTHVNEVILESVNFAVEQLIRYTVALKKQKDQLKDATEAKTDAEKKAENFRKQYEILSESVNHRKDNQRLHSHERRVVSERNLKNREAAKRLNSACTTCAARKHRDNGALITKRTE